MVALDLGEDVNVIEAIDDIPSVKQYVSLSKRLSNGASCSLLENMKGRELIRVKFVILVTFV